MKISTFTKIFSILVYTTYINTLMIVLDKNKEFCITKEILQGDDIKASFMFSGKHQSDFYTVLKNPHSKILYENKVNTGSIVKYKDNDEIRVSVTYSGEHALCFTAFKDSNAVVSFEFYTLNESGHIISVAKDDALTDMNKNVTVISYLFEEIEKNLKFYVERRDIHSKFTNEVINILEQVTFFKILIFSLFSLFQVYLIRKLFAKKINFDNLNVFSKGENI